MKDIEFLYLNQTDIKATGVSMETALEAVEDAFRLHYQGEVNLPYKTVLDLGERERGRSNAMPAYVGGEYDVCGDQPGRVNPEERIFFSPIGMAIEDVCLCHKVYKLARERGVGSTVGLFGRDLSDRNR